MKIVNEEDLPIPIKPEEVNQDQIREELRVHYAKVRKVPGEPLLFFDLIEESGSITVTNQCSLYLNFFFK